MQSFPSLDRSQTTAGEMTCLCLEGRGLRRRLRVCPPNADRPDLVVEVVPDLDMTEARDNRGATKPHAKENLKPRNEGLP